MAEAWTASTDSDSDTRLTPEWLCQLASSILAGGPDEPVGLDPAADARHPSFVKYKHRCTWPESDGLAEDWLHHETVWCNPGFSDVTPWHQKAIETLARARAEDKPFSVLVLGNLAHRTKYWRDLIAPNVTRVGFALRYVRFHMPDGTPCKAAYPVVVCLMLYSNEPVVIARFEKLADEWYLPRAQRAA